MSDELTAALSDLGAAYLRLESALTSAMTAPNTAFDGLVKLDEALTVADNFLPRLRELLAAADPGKPATAHVEDRATQLMELRAKISELRSQLAELKPVMGELAAAKAEHARLLKRRKDLQRQQRLNERLPEFQRTVAELSAATRAAQSATAAAEAELKETLDDWTPLASETVEQLEPRLARAYRRAQEKQWELTKKLEAERDAEETLSQLIEQLEGTSERHETARKETEEVVAALSLYAGADRAIVDALRESGIDVGGADPALEEIDAALRRHENGLRKIDFALKQQLQIRDTNPRVRRLGDTPAS
jgi:chromosome segregation ATPase